MCRLSHCGAGLAWLGDRTADVSWPPALYVRLLRGYLWADFEVLACIGISKYLTRLLEGLAGSYVFGKVPSDSEQRIVQTSASHKG